MTGVEAVSNGVMAFGEPRAKKAQWTLTVIIAILIVLLYGTAWLANHYQIMAMNPNRSAIPEHAEPAGGGGLRQGVVLPADHGQRVRSAGAECEYCVR